MACRLLLSASALFGALLVSPRLPAQDLEVTVKDSVTSALIEGAQVSLYCGGELRASGTTDASGVAGLTLPVDNEADGLPTGGELLSGPYPNPAAGSSHALLSVEEAGSVSLALYDILEREVVSRSETMTRGRHRVDVDLGGLPPGTYFLRANVGGRKSSANVI